MAGLLVGQRVDDGIAELRIGARSNAMQVTNRQFGGDRFAAPLELERNIMPNRVVDNLIERIELRDVVPVHLHQDVARLQHVLARRARQHAGHDQHTGVLREALTHGRLGRARQA